MGYQLFEEPSVFYGYVRLKIDSKCIDIVNRFRNVTFGDNGSTEEVGALSIERADSPIWLPNGEQLARKQCNDTINAIFVVEDTVKFMDGNKEVCVKEFSRAIVLQAGNCFFGFDKGAWFDEYITVSRGDSIESVIRDCSEDWITDGPIWNEFSRRVRKL